MMNRIKPETVIQVKGIVRERPDKMRNPQMKTGDIEVLVENMEILNTCSSLPLQVASGSENASEETRLKYRYLDLRRQKMQQNLILRSKIAMASK
jgi:aspartyl-tRNA synthetase